MTVFLTCKNLRKSFGKHHILSGIDFEVRCGEIFGVLGCSGSGKTTLTKCLLQTLSCEGDFVFYGNRLDYTGVEKYFGFVPEKFIPYGNFCAEEILKILAWSHNVLLSVVEDLLVKLDLIRHRSLCIRHYSQSMLQRLGLAISYFRRPAFVVVDDPAKGLDSIGKQKIIHFLQDLNQDGTTIVFTSSALGEVEELCSRIPF